MQPEEAIEILKDPVYTPDIEEFDDFREAIKLAREALQLLENPTDPRLIYARRLLLGED